MSRQPPVEHVWRIAVLWHDTVLDLVTVRAGLLGTTLRLRTGDTLRATVTAHGLRIVAPFAELHASDGELLLLPAGHALMVNLTPAHATAHPWTSADGTLFHAAMIAAAVQAVLVCTLVLTPAPRFDSDAGAGFPDSEVRRLILAPGGTSPQRGKAALALAGRRVEEAERPSVVRRAGRALPRHSGAGLTLEQTLAEMERALVLGDGGTELKETLGDLAQSVARAPQLGAGVGGLAPKDPIAQGAGSGLVGPGDAHVERLHEMRDRAPNTALPTGAQHAIGPVSLIDVPHAEVALSEEFDIDPLVKEELTRAVRQRHNAVRYCYESWGLAANAGNAGRVLLEITLMPDGRVVEPVATASQPALDHVAACVQRMAAGWYLGDGLVDKPTVMSFPFLLKPARP